MSQPVTTTDQLTATQYVVPVQALQGLPQLAKATAPASPPAQDAAAGLLTPGFMVASLALAALAALGAWTISDGLYGGADIRAARAEVAALQQQAEALQLQNAELAQSYQQQQQAINGAAAALGCITNGGPVQ